VEATLWHIPISHFSEKTRWALDVKRVPHRRRALLAGVHPPVALVLTRGACQTAPVLVVGGRGIGDSTAIIAELERRVSDPPLYPADADERRRALELEDVFDTQLGPSIRRLFFHEMTSEPASLAEVTATLVPYAHPRMRGAAGRALRSALHQRFAIGDPERRRQAEDKVQEALDRLDAELDGRDHLCGDMLSVADITAASLFYPLAVPPEGPWVPSALPEAWRERTAAVADRPGIRWVLETYARHRRPAAQVDAAARPLAPA
jgi:glutathione S-transferase